MLSLRPLELGTGIFNSDGDAWKSHRASARRFFLKENLKDFSVYAKHTDSLIAAIRKNANYLPSKTPHSIPLEFHHLAQRFTLDAASEFLFGDDVVRIQLLPFLDKMTMILKRMGYIEFHERCYQRPRGSPLSQCIHQGPGSSSAQVASRCVNSCICAEYACLTKYRQVLAFHGENGGDDVRYASTRVSARTAK